MKAGRETYVQTIFYDADGNPTDDASAAVRGEVVEFDLRGNVLRRWTGGGLSWKVVPKSVDEQD
jgi:LDH2 family malate/lactate/ureidoglycolate dehydrogenase